MLETGKKLTDSLVDILSISFFNLRGNMKTLRSFFLSFILGISAWPTLAVEPVNKHQDEPQSRIDTYGLPTFTSKLSQPIPFPGSRFGAAVSVSLNTAAVGAPGFSPTQANQGGVYIFARQNGNWTLTQTITPLDATANSQFGCSVSLYGDTLVIGARGDATTQAGQGAAYIYGRTNGSWIFQAKLLPSDAASNDAFGFSVSLFGNVAVIGAPGKGITGVNQGAAYIFSRTGTSWRETIRLKANDGQANDQFGTSVSISDRLVAVGSPGNDNFGIDQGAGYVYEFREGIGWGQVAKLLSNDGNANHNLGTAIAINGRTVIAGAPGVPGAMGVAQGAAYAFNDQGGNSWQQTTKMIPSDGSSNNRFGTAVAIAGRNAVIGSPGSLVNGNALGAIYSFQRVGRIWTFANKISVADGQPFDTFGNAVALNGGTAFVGSPNVSVNSNTGSGAVYIFRGYSKNAATPGQFRPSNGFAFLRNSNDTGFADREFFFGQSGDIPVSGDWNGDGIDTIGIYRNGTFFLRNSNTSGFADIQFPFGTTGDLPIVGDWDGDGIDTIGIVRGNSVFLRNSNTTGNANLQFNFGSSTDIFIVGDWDGDGIDTIGAFRPSNGFVYLRNSNTTGIADLEFFYGQAGDKPIVGDWKGEGVDTIGIVRGNQWFLRNSNSSGFADIQFFYGTDTDTPITGDWDGY